MCLTGVGRVANPPPINGCPVVVATGLTSSLPMIPSAHVATPLTVFAGPNSTPAVLDAALAIGERYIVRTLFTKPQTGHWRAPVPIWSLTREMLPPFVGSPP